MDAAWCNEVSMKFFQTLGKWLTGMCVYFTVLAVPFTLIGILISGDLQKSISLGSYILFIPAAMCISAAGVLLASKSVPRWLRILGHYIITVLAVIIFVWLPSNTQAKPSTVFLLFVAFTVVYWLLFGLVHLIRGRIKRLLEETSK